MRRRNELRPKCDFQKQTKLVALELSKGEAHHWSSRSLFDCLNQRAELPHELGIHLLSPQICPYNPTSIFSDVWLAAAGKSMSQQWWWWGWWQDLLITATHTTPGSTRIDVTFVFLIFILFKYSRKIMKKNKDCVLSPVSALFSTATTEKLYNIAFFIFQYQKLLIYFSTTVEKLRTCTHCVRCQRDCTLSAL